ncbi:hypothetical protein NTE_01780 [Candidatus Nitrososphaera evergladensis SR1]|uniref:Uncharacterized protein n=1 Tax=Candidatus Nitrososphaera evergladensis SR1 TaxID=1459636 RepID=A0A075MQM9_9ARCH|nr:hypothetical protein [Candidatus Nitrososphaera evergladensis]AIF83841.1 hypothetical protein NTE_01780 [Candidatus Nitrososphaera evergladensis SR1]
MSSPMEIAYKKYQELNAQKQAQFLQTGKTESITAADIAAAPSPAPTNTNSNGLSDEAQRTLATQTFLEAQRRAQDQALYSGQTQNLSDFLPEARQAVEDSYTVAITPGFGKLGGGSRYEEGPMRTMSIPIHDKAAEAKRLEKNYAAYQSQNLAAQRQSLAQSGQNGASQRVYVSRLALGDNILQFVREQEKGGKVKYAGQVEVSPTGDITPLFVDVAESKKNYADFMSVQRQNGAIRAANEKAQADYDAWISDMQAKGFGGLVETKDSSGKTTAKFTTFTSGGKTVGVRDDGTFEIPDPYKDAKLNLDAAEQVWRFGVEGFGAAGAGLVSLGGNLISKAEDALGFKAQAERTRNNSAAASQAIKSATDLGAFSTLTESIGRTFGSDTFYAESSKAAQDKKIIDAQNIPVGSIVGLGAAYGVKELEKSGMKQSVESATGLSFGSGDEAIAQQYKALQERPVEFIGGTIADILTFGNPVKIVKGVSKVASGLKLTRSVEKEAQAAAKRAGVEGDVSVRPIEQRKIPATGEVVDVPLQPTRFANVAVASRNVKIPLVGGKKIDLGIMQNETPIASINIPESISVKKLTINPTREVVTQEGTPIGIISPRSNTAVIQNPSPLPLAAKADLVGQDVKSVAAVQDTTQWIKNQAKAPSAEEIKLKATDPYYNSPKIQEMIEGYALKNDFTLNSKSAKLSKKLEPLYSKADNLRMQKEQLQSELSDINDHIAVASNQKSENMFAVDSSTDAATSKEVADLTSQKSDLLQKISGIDEKLTGIESEISSTTTAFGIKRADALGALQHASEFFYKVGGKGRINPAKGGAPADVMFPKVQNAPKSSNLIASSTTDVYNLEQNPALPSARLSRLAGYDLARDSEGLDPLSGNYFITKGGKAIKLMKEQVATDVEFDLNKVSKFVKEDTKRSKAVSDEARTKKPSTPFTFNVEPGRTPSAELPKTNGGKLIEVSSAKEAPSFASVKNTIFEAESSARVKGLGLGGNAGAYTNIGAIGLGGLTGAERVSKKKTSQNVSESTEFLRYPGESLSHKTKQDTRTDSLLNLGSLSSTANPFNLKPQKGGLDVANPFSHGTGSKTGGKADIIMTPRDITSTGSRLDQGTITDLNFRLDTTTGRPPRSPPTSRKVPPIAIPTFMPGGVAASQGSKGGVSSFKQRGVKNILFGAGAFDIQEGGQKQVKAGKSKGKKKSKGLWGGGLL